MRMKDSALCIRCKGGKRLCGRNRCPYLDRVNTFTGHVTIDDHSFWGSTPPSVFIGRYGYPKVNVGPVLPPVRVFKPERLEETRYWLDKSIEDIIGMRGSMYRMSNKAKIKNSYEPRSPFLAKTQELALSAKSVDTEVHLRAIPKMNKLTRFDSRTAPVGPTVEADRVDLGENPKVPRKVDYLTSDIHARAAKAMEELYRDGISVNHITRVLSAGLLGRAKDRRLVPTRWSITASDDILSKKLAEEVKRYQQLNDVLYFRHSHFGNHFHILLVPGIYSFEMVESWLKGAFWSEDTVVISDAEGYRGRKDYAENITGAYYAARLSVLDHLKRIRRQASILIYREITDEYWAPLGVWVIRDGVKEAMKRGGKKIDSVNDGVSHITKKVEVKNWWRRSKLLRDMREQTKIDDFL